MIKSSHNNYMRTFSNDFVTKIYDLDKTPQAISDFLNSEWVETLSNGKIKKRMMWERFEGAYLNAAKIDRYEDISTDVYLYAHKLLSRCVLNDVAPYFESDGQLFSYFQFMVRNSRINDSIKETRDRSTILFVDDFLSSDCDNSSNLEDSLFKSDYDGKDVLEILELVESLRDSDLVLIGKLFVENNFSFDGIYGLCGFSFEKFKDVKKRFILEMRKLYEKKVI